MITMIIIIMIMMMVWSVFEREGHLKGVPDGVTALKPREGVASALGVVITYKHVQSSLPPHVRRHIFRVTLMR